MGLDTQRHLSQELIANYVAGLAGDEERFVVDVHVAECDACLQLVTEAQLLADLWDSYTARRHGEAVARLWERQAEALQFAVVLGAIGAETSRRMQALGVRARRERCTLMDGETTVVDEWEVALPESAGSVTLRLSRTEGRSEVQVKPDIPEAAAGTELTLWELLEGGKRRRAASATCPGGAVTLETSAAGDLVLSLACSIEGRKRVWEIKLHLG